RHRGPSRGLVETLLSLPLVLPPTAVGLMLLRALAPTSRLGFDILFTWRGVLVAMAVMGLPLLVRTARAAFDEVDPQLLAVARSLGASPISAFFRVALPLAGRGVAAGLLLSFARSLGEFGATILVAGNIEGETQTLALAIYQRNQTGDDAGAMRLVLITVVIAFAAVFATEALVRKKSR
ncbi:MAG: molybdate ABC transporter permease subunit, partial [Polyangiales bacterium]